MSTGTNRARLLVAVVTAFVGGLIVASGLNWTKLGFAQGRPAPAVVQPIADASNAFVAIANNVTPAVVSIDVFSAARAAPQQQRGRTTPQGVPPGMEDFFRNFDLPQQSRPTRGQGSGFLVTANGYILTNNHVVTSSDRETVADRVTVRMMDHRVFTARVVGHDRTTDVAVLKIEGNNFPTLPLGSDATTRIGEWVLAIGNPLGLENTVTAGIISAKGRSLGPELLNPDGRNQYAISDLIQTDAAINPGNSGGPLVNARGEVIGINSAIASSTGYNAGYGFAIPITLAKRVMDEILAHGRVRIPALGIGIEDVTPADAAVAGVKDIRGVLVRNFPSDTTPAKRAGLQAGDVIVKADGQDVDRVSTLQRIVRNHNPGETVEVEVMRYGQQKTFRVKLMEAPETRPQTAMATTRTQPAGGGSVQPSLGISVAPVSTELAAQSRMTAPVRGVLVSDVIPGGPAERELARNDVITEILYPAPRRAILTPADFENALGRLKNGDYISLNVFSLGDPLKQTRVVNLRVGG
ncbi:MAG: trypsin-like peptidase domain-containing protein [Gemmatimonadota bacterium]|nr:trypsin-like peptidase domain-containing protein [Gemmatimonadota bacterium]